MTALLEDSEVLILKAANNIAISLADSISSAKPWSHPEPSALDDAFAYGQVVDACRAAADGLHTAITQLEKVAPND